jgi:hypothetical protein
VAAACTLKRGQDAALATIAIRGVPAGRAAVSASPCPPLPNGGLKLNPHLPPPPKPPPGISFIPNSSPAQGCAYIVGYSDVKKLNGAALVGPGLLNVAEGVQTAEDTTTGAYIQVDSAGQLDYKPCPTCQTLHELPPAHATFLDFGFTPVTATLQLTEIGTINIYTVQTNVTVTNTAWSLMKLRVSDVTVDGQKLNVGPHCQTDKPLLIGFTGAPSYSLAGGGPLTGYITIPPFTGCGVTENLDPLITGTVSGPGNFAKFTQGSLCFLPPPGSTGGGTGCPPNIPKPLR